MTAKNIHGLLLMAWQMEIADCKYRHSSLSYGLLVLFVLVLFVLFVFNHAFQTNHSEVQYFDRLYEAKDVVKTGLRDLYKTKKDYSVHGLPVKVQVLLVKFVPHSMVMNIWLNQQKKAKNNTNLTTK